MITKLQLRVFVFLNILVPSVVSRFSASPDYFCNEETCTAYALLRAKSHSSNLSSYFSIAPSDLAAAHLGVRHSEKKRKKRKMWMIGVYIAIGVVLMACIGVVIALLWRKLNKKRLCRIGRDVEQQQQQLSLSIRTTSENKVSFDGSQYNIDDQKTRGVESYAFEDLQKATQDFCLGNLIQSSVFHGRLKGKNIAVKRVASEAVPFFQKRFHHSLNVITLLGTCAMDGPDSFLVLEYASNGCLKDWLHGGLAIKSHFIASCSCFLSWNQRLKICVDVATALQYMHHVMDPCYLHRNVTSGNIFLDEDFGAKLGMPKVVDDDEEEASADIFAYGVVLLEVLSGKPPATDRKLCDEIKGILASEDAEELRGWMDSALGDNYSFDGAVTLANIARSCVEEDPSSRPNAAEVVDKVLRLVEEMPVGEEDFNICESSCRPLVM